MIGAQGEIARDDEQPGSAPLPRIEAQGRHWRVMARALATSSAAVKFELLDEHGVPLEVGPWDKTKWITQCSPRELPSAVELMLINESDQRTPPRALGFFDHDSNANGGRYLITSLD